MVDVAGGERPGRRHGQVGAVHDGPDRPAGCRLGVLTAVLDQRRGWDAAQAGGDVGDVAAPDLRRELRADLLGLSLSEVGRLAVRLGPHDVVLVVVEPADADRVLEQSLRGRRGHLVAGAGAAGRLAEDGDVAGVAAEAGDVLLDPAQSGLLVREPVVAGVRPQRLVRQEAEDAQPVVGEHVHDLAAVNEIIPVVGQSRPEDPAPWTSYMTGRFSPGLVPAGTSTFR